MSEGPDEGKSKEPKQQPDAPKYTPSDMERYFNDPEFRRKHSKKNLWQRFSRKAKITAGAVLAVLILGIVYWNYLVSGLPSLERIENPKAELASKVFSADGEVLDQFYIKNRSHLGFADIPKTVVDALIATEDKDFYNHWGVDLVRLGKAIIKDIFALRLK